MNAQQVGVLLKKKHNSRQYAIDLCYLEVARTSIVGRDMAQIPGQYLMLSITYLQAKYKERTLGLS